MTCSIAEMDVVSLSALALLLGAVGIVYPAPAIVFGLTVVVLFTQTVPRGAWLLAALSCGCGALRAGAEIEEFARAREHARDALGAPRTCEARAKVVSSPVVMRQVQRWDADLTDPLCEGRPLQGRYRARLYGQLVPLARDDEVFVVVSVAPTQLFLNHDLFDPRPAAARRKTVWSGSAVDVQLVTPGVGVRATIDRLRQRARADIVRVFSEESAPFARALVLGESDLDPQDDEAFRTSGIAHLLAVSGSHLVLVVGALLGGMRWALRRAPRLARRTDVGRWAALGVIPLCWAYADFAGGSGSACRAAAMLTAALMAKGLGRRSHAARAFSLSIVGCWLCEPLVVFDVSFSLSLTATLGLLTLLPRIRTWSHAHAHPRWHWPLDALATTLAATLPCAPILSVLSPVAPLGGLLANVLAVPVGELFALPLCLLDVLLAPCACAQKGCAIVAGGSLLGLRIIARALAGIRFLSPPIPALHANQLALLASAGLASFAARPRHRPTVLLCGAAALLLSEGWIRRGRVIASPLRITHLDVGQGDATLVEFPDASAMLVDGGGMVGSPIDMGTAVLLPILQARRISHLRAVVLSHPHPDHFLGLSSALPRLTVDEFWDSGQGEREGAGATFAAMMEGLRQRHTSILGPEALCQKPRVWGGVTVSVLAPCPDIVPGAPANDNSLVLRIAFGHRSALLVGDAERAEETALLDQHRSDLHADLLKVGHHGSRTSTSASFLDAVRPVQAVLSCGVRNRFGHPAPVTLEALQMRRIHTHRTDRQGSFVWETDGAEVTSSAAADAR